MSFTMPWANWYKLAESYYNYYGNLRVKQNFKTKNGYEYDENGYRLGAWLNGQQTKHKQGLLLEEQKKKLEALGVQLGNTHDVRWNRMYELAKKYYEHYGHLKIQKNFRTSDGYTYDENGKKLGLWINDQRTAYAKKNLSQERINKLNDIGAVLENVREDNWDKMYELAKKFYQHYGHLKVPNQFKTKNGYEYSDEGKKLGLWILNRRRLYTKKKLSSEHMEKLEQIGMLFEDVHDKEWDRIYNLAKIYYEYYGHLKVKIGFKTKDGYTYYEDGCCLHSWLDSQRSAYRKNKLSQYRIQKLQSIGMVFSVKKNISENILLCEMYGIDYNRNKRLINSIPHREFEAKMNYLNSLNIPFCINGQLHPIFFTSNINMQAKYGISLETLLTQYTVVKDKTKTI